MAGGFTSEAFEIGLLPQVREFVVRSWAIGGLSSVLHVGDLHWLLRPARPHFDAERDLRIWRDASGSVVGAAWFDGAASGEVMLPTMSEPVLDDMLDWLVSGHLASGWAEDAPHFSVQAWAGDAQWQRALERRGYHSTGAVGHRMHRPVAVPATPVKVPPGFRFADAAELGFFEQREAVVRTAFPGEGPDVARWTALRDTGGYQDSLDVLLVDAGGRGVASALCWHDAANRSGEFEPVGVGPRLQGTGLGRVVMAEGLRRLADAGASSAIVGAEAENAAAISLYKRSGFGVAGTRLAFRRELTAESPRANAHIGSVHGHNEAV